MDDLTKIMIYENLTPSQRDEVFRPRTKDKCCQLNGIKCRIQETFGYEAKSDICKNSLCEKERT